MSSINTEFCQKYLRYQGFLEDVLGLSIFYHCIILLQHGLFSMRLQYIEQLSPFYTYTHKEIPFLMVQMFNTFNQSHIYKLFFELTQFSLIFSCFSAELCSPTFLTFSFILSYFCFSIINALNSSWLFSCQSVLEILNFNAIKFIFSQHKNHILLFLFVFCCA